LRKTIALFILILFNSVVDATAQQLSKPLTSEEYLHVLDGAKDSLYSKILQTFNSYIEVYPRDYMVQIERCRFIESAYYDLEEDYNPHENEAEECRENLIASFPGVPEVLLYKMDFVYGDSEIVFLKSLMEDYKADHEKWNGKGFWKVYSKFADYYDRNEKHGEAITYGEQAVAENDTLDLSILLAKNYIALKQNTKAIKVLSSHLDSSNVSWMLNEKGKLLLELGVPDKAIFAFHLAGKDTNSWMDEGSLAQAMIQNGLYAEARTYLVKDAVSDWNKAEKLRNLFNYDIKYSPADSAKATYRTLMNEGFWSDPLGIYRLRLFLHAPFLGWNGSDLLHLLLLLLAFLAAIIIPYLWILPIHYLSSRYKSKGVEFPSSEFRWGLRSFWMMCSLIIIVDLVASLLFIHDKLFFGGDEDATVQVTKSLADFSVASLTGYMIVALLFLKKSDLGIFWGKVWPKQKSIFTGIGLAFLLWMGMGIYTSILKAFGISIRAEGVSTILSIRDNITSINAFYHPLLGFLFVVILVPIYEEILFRGIFLGACQKYMSFILANLLQAAAFALMHFEWKLIPFFLAFGLMAGHYREKTQSLAPGISMHMTNNFIAFLAISMQGVK